MHFMKARHVTTMSAQTSTSYVCVPTITIESSNTKHSWCYFGNVLIIIVLKFNYCSVWNMENAGQQLPVYFKHFVPWCLDPVTGTGCLQGIIHTLQLEAITSSSAFSLAVQVPPPLALTLPFPCWLLQAACLQVLCSSERQTLARSSSWGHRTILLCFLQRYTAGCILSAYNWENELQFWPSPTVHFCQEASLFQKLGFLFKSWGSSAQWVCML